MGIARDIGVAAQPAAPDVIEGRQVVAVVGIDRYREWPCLDNAVNDAKGALRVLGQLGFAPIVTPLIDETASAEAIRRLVTDDLAKELRGNDSLVLFFAGHGHTRTQTLQSGPVETGFLIPVDGDGSKGHAATWLRLDTLLSDVARLPARHILVILDACHSGIALGSLIKSRGVEDRLRDGALDALRRRQSRRVITSALGNQEAMDGGPIRGHSLFTGYLIEGLTEGLARDGRSEVTGSELGLYVQRYVTAHSRSQQTPDFGTFELDERGELVMATATQPPARDAAPPAADVPPPRPAGAPRSPTRQTARSISRQLLVPALAGFTGFCAVAGVSGVVATRAGIGVQIIIVGPALVIAIVAGRAVKAAPAVVRRLSAMLLRRTLWAGAVIAAVIVGAVAGMNERAELEQACRQGLAAAEGLRPTNQEAARAAFDNSARACGRIGRDEDVRRAVLAAAASSGSAEPAIDTPKHEEPPKPAPPRDSVRLTSMTGQKFGFLVTTSAALTGDILRSDRGWSMFADANSSGTRFYVIADDAAHSPSVGDEVNGVTATDPRTLRIRDEALSELTARISNATARHMLFERIRDQARLLETSRDCASLKQAEHLLRLALGVERDPAVQDALDRIPTQLALHGCP